MSEEVYKLWKVHKTVSQMLRDRKYNIQKQQLEYTIEQFKQQYSSVSSQGGLEQEYAEIDRSKLSFISQLEKDASSNILVVFQKKGEKIGSENIDTYQKVMKGANAKRAIIVIPTSPGGRDITPKAKTRIAEYATVNYFIEIFKETELLINITEHQLVPKHEPLSEEEKKALLKKYTLKETQLPRILVTDPVARYFGLRRGQVVKITRPSETAGKYVCYRYCV